MIWVMSCVDEGEKKKELERQVALLDAQYFWMGCQNPLMPLIGKAHGDAVIVK